MCARNLFLKKNIDRLEIVQIASIYNTTDYGKEYKQSIKWSKKIRKKSFTTLLVYIEESLLQGKSLIGGFDVFKLLVVLLIKKVYT